MRMEKSTNNGSIANFFDVYFLGIVLVISGVLTYWNVGFAVGFWEYALCNVVIAAGGSYGFARVTMGPYLGFIIGSFDSVTNIIYVSSLVRGLTEFITNTIGDSVDHKYDPVYWLICYVFCLIVLIPLGRWNFSFMTIIGTITLVLPIVYVLSTANTQDFERYVIQEDRHPFFQDGMSSFMQILPVPTWMYIGIDLVCLVCDDTKDAVTVVPRAIVAAMVTLILLAFLIMVTSAANAPGIVDLAAVAFPLNAGYSTAFKISDRMATILSIPGVFISTYSLMYAYGRQICALSRSKLVPTFLSWTTRDNVPYMALCGGCLLGYSILLGLYYNDPNYLVTLNDLFLASQMGSFTVYIVSMLSFVIFRYKYSAMERHYVNRLGVASAVVGIVIFLFAFVGVGFFQKDGYESIAMYTTFVGGMTFYYVFYARHQECFSPEEQSILFAAYVIKTNSRKRTLWNWVGRKIKATADHIDPSHKLSDLLSGNGAHHHHRKMVFQSSGSRSGSRPHSPHNRAGGTKSKAGSNSSSPTKQSATEASKAAVAAPSPVMMIGDEVVLFSHDENEGADEEVLKNTADYTKSRSRSDLDEQASFSVRMKKEPVNSAHNSNSAGGENYYLSTMTTATTTVSSTGNLKIVPIDDDEYN